MYLNKLNYNEKCSFIELANLISEVDGEVSIGERLVIDQYLTELGLNKDYEFSSNNFDIVIKSFDESSPTAKKIVLFEILILVYSDNEFCKMEQEALDLISKSFNIGKEDYDTLVDLTNRLTSSMKKVSSTIFG